MLGFDALGRLALGQVESTTAVNFVLTAVVGAFAVTGVAATFKVTETASVGSYSVSGQAVTLNTTMAVTAVSYAVTGNAGVFNAFLEAGAGSYVVTGYSASLAVPSPQATRRPLYIRGVSYWRGRQ